jgi:putative ABC transport system permease protein
MSISASYKTDGENVDIPEDELTSLLKNAAAENGLDISFAETQRYLSCAFCIDGDIFVTDRDFLTNNLVECWFVTAEEYEQLTGETLDLSAQEMAVYGLPNNSTSMPDSFTLGGNRFTCTVQLKSYPVSMAEYSIVDCFGFVVRDEAVLQEIYEIQKEAYQEYASEISQELAIDFSDEDAVEAVYEPFIESLRAQVSEYAKEQPDAIGGYSMRLDSKWDSTEYLYGMVGTLLFLGLLLSFVFLFATALIIYYKQISEGYEDRERFRIMQKVGMANGEVRQAIRSQILLVFFLPLVVAAIHIAFAFPILTRLLRVLFQANQPLFIGCTIASLAVFVVIYVLIYRITARIYYQIICTT